jgi:hypothetical protein
MQEGIYKEREGWEAQKPKGKCKRRMGEEVEGDEDREYVPSRKRRYT